MMKKMKLVVLAGSMAMLSSCDLSQIPGMDGKMSAEDSKAVGAACRHSGRALEDCFAMNPKAHPAGVFDGWRDMNDYMVANKIDTVTPQIESSAYKKKAEPSSDGQSSESTSPSKSEEGGDANRPRWMPKSGAAPSEEKEAATDQASTKSASKPEKPDVKAESKPADEKPSSDKADTGKSEKPKSDSGARPWERKKDSKSHT